ncbi:MAG: translation initiation factor IF-3, partial [bacterium]
MRVTQTSAPINYNIRARTVMVIDESNQNLGVLPRDQAIAMAEERGLDLVVVGPRADNPVCKFMNYEKHLYQQEKKHKEVMKTQRKTTPKEVKLGIRIGPQDFDTKMRRAREFLMDGLKVKIVIEFRGWRELSHSEQGYEKIDKIKGLFREIA